MNVHVLAIIEGAERDIVFPIDPHQSLGHFKRAYCAFAGLNEGVVRFVFDGDEISNNQFANNIELEEGFQIDCLLK